MESSKSAKSKVVRSKGANAKGVQAKGVHAKGANAKGATSSPAVAHREDDDEVLFGADSGDERAELVASLFAGSDEEAVAAPTQEEAALASAPEDAAAPPSTVEDVVDKSVANSLAFADVFGEEETRAVKEETSDEAVEHYNLRQNTRVVVCHRGYRNRIGPLIAVAVALHSPVALEGALPEHLRGEVWRQPEMFEPFLEALEQLMTRKKKLASDAGVQSMMLTTAATSANAECELIGALAVAEESAADINVRRDHLRGAEASEGGVDTTMEDILARTMARALGAMDALMDKMQSLMSSGEAGDAHEKAPLNVLVAPLPDHPGVCCADEEGDEGEASMARQAFVGRLQSFLQDVAPATVSMEAVDECDVDSFAVASQCAREFHARALAQALEPWNRDDCTWVVMLPSGFMQVEVSSAPSKAYNAARRERRKLQAASQAPVLECETMVATEADGDVCGVEEEAKEEAAKTSAKSSQRKPRAPKSGDPKEKKPRKPRKTKEERMQEAFGAPDALEDLGESGEALGDALGGGGDARVEMAAAAADAPAPLSAKPARKQKPLPPPAIPQGPVKARPVILGSMEEPGTRKFVAAFESDPNSDSIIRHTWSLVDGVREVSGGVSTKGRRGGKRGRPRREERRAEPDDALFDELEAALASSDEEAAGVTGAAEKRVRESDEEGA